ncbi:MAG: hypothetical protein IT305_08870 [Chloroflexi bacterium]|nr:hypothetical protein [Chloroflexota bacterium]
MLAAVRCLTVLVVLCFLGLPSVPAVAQAPPDAGDYDIPNGHFFTQAAPGQRGAGYRVANEAGIPFWDAFQDKGGVEALGYPLTGRFIWKNQVVQVFQRGALRWRADRGSADVVPAKEIGEPPSTAKRAEPALRLVADAERYPWSGWWWPANDVSGGPRLFDPGGPLARYDTYVASLGKPDPDTQTWERTMIRFPGYAWAGHCNGWAAAALLEPEPQHTRVVNGVEFTVADQKGLLSSYHFADAALWAVGGDGQDVTPGDFHRSVMAWLRDYRKGVIFTFQPSGDELWSYAAFKVESVVGPDPLEADLWHVRTVVWLVDNNVPPGFVGARPWPGADGKVFEYTVRGDPWSPSAGGDWSTANQTGFGRPFMVWYPDSTRRNLDRPLASPALDYRTILEITRGGVPTPVFSPR